MATSALGGVVDVLETKRTERITAQKDAVATGLALRKQQFEELKTAETAFGKSLDRQGTSLTKILERSKKLSGLDPQKRANWETSVVETARRNHGAGFASQVQTALEADAGIQGEMGKLLKVIKDPTKTIEEKEDARLDLATAFPEYFKEVEGAVTDFNKRRAGLALESLDDLKTLEEQARTGQMTPQDVQSFQELRNNREALEATVFADKDTRESFLSSSGVGGTQNREQTKIKFATDVAQSKLDAKLKETGEEPRQITNAEVGVEYEDIYGESPAESLLKAQGKSAVKITETEFVDFGKQVSESDAGIRKNIRSVGVINAGLKQLEKGIISGTFANAELAVNKALNKLNLVNPETKERITNTESYAGFMGIRTGEVIRLFGAGTGLSDEDRKFANRISAGDITLDAPSLKRLQVMNKQLLLEEAIIHNELVDDLNIARDDRDLKPSIRKKVDINKFLPKGDGKTIDVDNANLFKAAARGDRVLAEQIAKEKGWVF